jgi:hypothetical protein
MEGPDAILNIVRADAGASSLSVSPIWRVKAWSKQIMVMETNQTEATYRVWGADNVAYGPVELPAMGNWVRDDRVTADTWVFFTPENIWRKAGQYPELKLFFDRKAKAGAGSAEGASGARGYVIKPGSLRRIKIFAGMDEKQLESFLQYMEIVPCKQFSHVVRKGDHGDSMYLVIEGEVRALTMVDGKESILSTMMVGDFFGEISILDQGPRSADVVANRDSVLLKISASAFDQLVKEAPALAMPFLLQISRSVVGRVRVLTKRYEDSIHLTRLTAAIR